MLSRKISKSSMALLFAAAVAGCETRERVVVQGQPTYVREPSPPAVTYQDHRQPNYNNTTYNTNNYNDNNYDDAPGPGDVLPPPDLGDNRYDNRPAPAYSQPAYYDVTEESNYFQNDLA